MLGSNVPNYTSLRPGQVITNKHTGDIVQVVEVTEHYVQLGMSTGFKYNLNYKQLLDDYNITR
jgi:hypothetical protein